MEDLPMLKTDTSDKLEKEKENLALLQESLSRSEVMTQNMLGILNSFENRLSKLEETIIPIYQETGNLQRRHENIEKTLGVLDNVLGYYHVAEEVEPVINAGPKDNLETYLQCMEKIQESMQYFGIHSPDSPEIAHVTSLYDVGKNALEKEFKNILVKYSGPTPAVSILDVLAVEEDEEPPELEHLPESVLRDLTNLSTWLQSCGSDSDYMNIYAKIRTNILVRSLECLKDHLRSGSADSTVRATPAGPMGPMGSNSPALGSKFRPKESMSQSSKKAVRRMAFVKKASSTILKSMARLEAAGVLKPISSSADLKEEETDINIDYYLTSVSALLILIQSEWSLMQEIIPEKHQRRVFDLLVQAGLDVVVKEGEQIAVHIKRATARRNTPAIISVFPVLKHLRAIKPEFDITLEGCQAPTRAKLVTLISTLDSTGAKALEDFVEVIRNDPDKSSNMPRDGTVHQLTSNTMIFLEQLLEFSDTAGAMLLTQDPASIPHVQNIDRHTLKLAEFITRVLSALGLNLNNKSESYNDQTLTSIFMLNNYNYMLKTLRRSDMLDVVHTWNNEVGSFYDEQVLHQKRLYSQRIRVLHIVHHLNPEVESMYVDQVTRYRRKYADSWSGVLSHISEGKKPVSGSASSSHDGKLKDKERQAVKDKFTGFNKEIMELVQGQKGLAIPDPELRESLRKDNKEYVLPFFKAFIKKYSKCNFTRNPEKYLKYTENDIEYFLDNLFDAAA